MTFKTLEDFIGKTPLVRLQRINPTSNTILVKLEGNNPAGSVKDRPALSMINEAEKKGLLNKNIALIEATSGNTGIALAMACAIKGYKLKLIMPDNMTPERIATMSAYGAEIILVTQQQSMEGARDLALAMQTNGEGMVLDQFSNFDNPLAHYKTTGPEIWQDSKKMITHFVSAMGTTGTIMGTADYLKEQNEKIQIIGVQPGEGEQIPGIRRWPKEYLPKIFDANKLDATIDVTKKSAETITRLLAKKEGIFCGESSGGAVAAALQLADTVTDAVIVTIICDRGDRYLSTDLFKK